MHGLNYTETFNMVSIKFTNYQYQLFFFASISQLHAFSDTKMKNVW